MVLFDAVRLYSKGLQAREAGGSMDSKILTGTRLFGVEDPDATQVLDVSTCIDYPTVFSKKVSDLQAGERVRGKDGVVRLLIHVRQSWHRYHHRLQYGPGNEFLLLVSNASCTQDDQGVWEPES